jgi:hypothetical protein
VAALDVPRAPGVSGEPGKRGGAARCAVRSRVFLMRDGEEKAMKTWLALLVVILGAGAWAWPKSSAMAGADQGNARVQIVPAGQKQVGHPGERGATYYALEAQTTRMTTKFKGGYAAVAERGLIGDVQTTLRDQAGNERARLRVNRIDGGHDMVHYEPSGGTPLQALSDPGVVKPTLDWATRQAYSFAKDGSDDLIWDRGTMRRKGAPRRDVEGEVESVETVWANGLIARLTRQDYSRREIAPGRIVQGSALVSELTLHGVPAGLGVWFEKDQVFAYTLPGLMAGAVVIGPDDLKANYGGWPFTPDMTWLNLQIIASHHFKTLQLKQGTVARGCEPSQPSRLAQFFVPTVYANEAGCDDFHWLDGGMLRDCCDDHDRCYAKSGCDSSSWWVWWRSWSCDRCNLSVVGCFFSRGQLDERCLRRQECAG